MVSRTSGATIGNSVLISRMRNGNFSIIWFTKSMALARALSVVHDLVGRGLDPMRLSASGLGQFQPLDPANTAEARAQNRRIELTLTER